MITFCTKSYHVIKAVDLNALVRITYGQKYEFEADNECSRDSYYAFDGMKVEALDAYDQNKLDSFTRTGKGMYVYTSIIQDLVNKGLIPQGNLLITTD